MSHMMFSCQIKPPAVSLHRGTVAPGQNPGELSAGLYIVLVTEREAEGWNHGLLRRDARKRIGQ